MSDRSTLVATLGGQPQIITFTLDLLLELDSGIDQVVVVYLASGLRYHEAFRRLVGEFAGDRYAGQACRLRSVPVRSGDLTLAEAQTPQEVEAVRATFFELLADLKARGHRLHLSLSGGRRIMALTALAAAMQHLTPADRVWHLYTPPDLTEAARDGRIMHLPKDSGVRLIEVPFVPWAAYFPGLRPLLESSPDLLRRLTPAWLDDGERQRCERVWEALTPRQQEALRLLSRGLTRAQTAAQMGIAVTTVDSHLKAITGECLKHWEPGEGLRINLVFIRERFGMYLLRHSQFSMSQR